MRVDRADLDRRLGRPDGDRDAALVVIDTPGAATFTPISREELSERFNSIMVAST